MSQPTNQLGEYCSAFLITALLGYSASVIGNDKTEATALERLANRLDEQSYHLEVVSRLNVDGIQRFTVKNHKSKNIEEINLDQNDREVSNQEMQRILSTKTAKEFEGKLSQSLVKKRNAHPGEDIDVLVWTTMPDPLPSYDWQSIERQGEKKRQEMERFADAVSAGLHIKATNSLQAHAMKQGWQINYQATHAPLLALRLPANQLKRLENQPDVVAIFPDEKLQPASNVSVPAIDAPTVWNRGVTGTGVFIGVVEVPDVANGLGSTIYFPHVNLLDGFVSNLGQAFSQHATMVAGIIASTHAVNRGVAFGAPALWSANSTNTNESGVIAAADNAVTIGGVQVLNFSVGVDYGNATLNVLDYYVDNLVRNHRKTVVVAAGNISNTCAGTNRVATPGRAWNVITVGNYDDKNTITNK